MTVQLYKYKDEGDTSVQRQCGRSVDEGNFQVPGRKTKVRIFGKTQLVQSSLDAFKKGKFKSLTWRPCTFPEQTAGHAEEHRGRVCAGLQRTASALRGDSQSSRPRTRTTGERERHWHTFRIRFLLRGGGNWTVPTNSKSLCTFHRI